MITYDWDLNGVDITYLPETSEAQITDIHWGCVATDDATSETVSGVGSISVRDENYIFPAATVKNATREQVFGWLNSKLGDEKEEIKSILANQLAAKTLNDSFVPEE